MSYDELFVRMHLNIPAAGVAEGTIQQHREGATSSFIGLYYVEEFTKYRPFKPGLLAGLLISRQISHNQNNSHVAGKHALITVRQPKGQLISIRSQSALYGTASTRELKVWNDCDDVQDYVTVYDGYTTRDPVILKFCGGGEAVPETISSGHELLVEFSTSPYGTFLYPPPAQSLHGFQLEVEVCFSAGKDKSRSRATQSSGTGSGAKKNFTPTGPLLQEHVPRSCDHGLLANVTRFPRPCSLAESYLTSGDSLTLELRLADSTALQFALLLPMRPLVSGQGLKTFRSNTQFGKVQRLVCLGISSAMRTAPTRAIKVLTGLPPLYLVAEYEKGEMKKGLPKLFSTSHVTGQYGASPSQILRIQIPNRNEMTKYQLSTKMESSGSRMAPKLVIKQKRRNMGKPQEPIYPLPLGHMLLSSRRKPVTFKALYEFVDLHLDGEPLGEGPCSRKFGIISDESQQKFQSPRDIFLYGRGGAKNIRPATTRYGFQLFIIRSTQENQLTAGNWQLEPRMAKGHLALRLSHLQAKGSPEIRQKEKADLNVEKIQQNARAASTAFEAGKDERIRITLSEVIVKNRDCKTGISKDTDRLECVGNTMATLRFFEVPWLDVPGVPKGLPVLQLRFDVTGMNASDDFNTLFFEGTWKFIRTPVCSRNLRYQGASGEVHFEYPTPPHE
ncbi:hypothetical protein NQ317_019499, partial [Molorchus minor]